MKIREVTKNDIEQIREIYSLAWVDEKTGHTRDEDINYFTGQVEKAIDAIQGSLNRDTHYLVAESDDNKIAGVIGFRKPAHKLMPFATTKNPVELYSLFVRDKQKGVGSMLVQKMEELTKSSGYTEIVVFSASRWKKSWIFYDKTGFTRVGTLAESSGQLSQLWRKNL